ncbi:hypothetical protein [Streptomyces sp. SID2119]|uniref:esterase/lipase family protein n=1 Tax=Streptomyces sp. SID2119 TaxID=2690253 RepID=UPI0031F677F0
MAKKFANHISTNYTKRGIKVDVVAHSMGGLVVRAALHYTHKRAPGFPKKLYIEDIVTLGTPHAGINHGQLITKTSGKHTGRIKHSGKWSKFSKRVSPVEQARLAVYYHSKT